MSASPTSGNGGGAVSRGGGSSGGDPAVPAPQYYDMRAPLTRPVTVLQVTGFTLREGMLPSLIMPDGSLYFGPTAEDGKYRLPAGCGIIFFHHDENVPSTFVQPAAPSSGANTGGLVSYFFGGGAPRDANAPGGDGAKRVAGQAAAAFTTLCRRYQQGDRYGGDWVNGVFHGEGVLVTSYFTYQGGWKDGLMHGKGTVSYTRKYVDTRPAAAAGGGGLGGGGGMGTLLLKGLSYMTPFELVATAAAPKEYFGNFDAAHGRHGTGIMRYFNGDVYEGDWQDNCRHGKGRLRKLDGEVYEGDWANDERHGFGKITYPSGALFKGLMQHDQRDGEGVMRFANGDEYLGNFAAGTIEGLGTMKYRNGDVYEGAWHDRLRHGQGKFTLKRTGTTMTGMFLNGLIHGEGTVVVPGVSTFVGIFARGERTVGTMHWHQQTQPEKGGEEASGCAEAVTTAAPPSPSVDEPLTVAATACISPTANTPSPTASAPLLHKAAPKNYLCYQGEWHGEHMTGKGLLWYTNGDFFAGRFRKSLRHGPGNMRYAAEQVEFSGHYVHDVRHGLGLLQRADGSIRAGRWQHDAFVEGYEGEWDGVVFHGIGRLTLPIDTFFGLRASNSTLKLSDVNAALHAASSTPPPPPPLLTGSGAAASTAVDEEGLVSGSNCPGTTTAAATAAGSDAMRRADDYPHFIDFFGVFRNGVRDGVGLLKLPALDCIVGGTLNLAEDRRGTGKTFTRNKNSRKASRGGAGAAAGNNSDRGKDSSASTVPSSGDSVPSVVIKGRWVRDVLHCQKGVLAFPNGIVYIGGFCNGARAADCARVWWPDGSVMESGWCDDAPSGPGVWYQRNRTDPIFQTIIPRTPRSSRSRRRCIPGSPAPASAAATVDTHGTKSGNDSGDSSGANGNAGGGPFGLSYLWGLVGLGFGGGSGRTGNDDGAVADCNADEEDDKPRRVLIDFHSHFAVSCTWYPSPMDLHTYTRVVLPQIAAQTAPLARDTPWPLLMHSATMSTAMSNCATRTTASSSDGPPPLKNGGNNSSLMMLENFTATPQQQQQMVPPSLRQIAAGATDLHLADPPAKISVGRANGPAVVYFDSGVVVAGEWLGNAPRLAVPYRPWSAYDGFVVWQASRPAARNCAATFPLWVSPRSQSCYSALLAAAPNDVRGEPKRTTADVYHGALSLALSPLAAGGSNLGEGATAGAAAAAESVSGVTSPDTRCTICAKEYSFFRKRVHCTLCLRSTCSSCLGQMDTDGLQQEDVKALLRHAYVTSEQTELLAAAAAKSTASSSSSGGAARRVVFPSISVEQVDHAFDGKGTAALPVCADCVRAMLWKLRYTQMWIPTSMFTSVVDIDRHQRDVQVRRQASAPPGDALKANTTEIDPVLAGGTTAVTEALAVATGDADTAGPIAPGEELRCESSRQVSAGSELLPASQIDLADVDHDAPHTPTSPCTLLLNDGLGDSPVPLSPPPPAVPATAVAASGSPGMASTSMNRYIRTPQDLPRPSGELLPPTQYITYSGYTSYSIPHIYGELWWGRRYYYRGGFCAGERHGFGVQYMPNGERYEGAFERDAWHGQGVYYLEDGAVLMGEFRRGELRIVQYHGEVEEDTAHGVRPHGRGIGYDSNGAVYNGEWMHGQQHGTGMLRLPDGVSVYSGTFVCGAMEGMGKLVTTSGAYYGDFSQNQQQGKGLLFTSSCVVEGGWVQGASSGFTRIYENSTGDVYETTYRAGNERDDCFPAPIMVDDAEAATCGQCGMSFSFFLRRHHCRLCGDVFCDACSQHRATLPANFAGDGDTAASAQSPTAAAHPNTVGQRVCDACFYRLTQRRMIALRRYKDGGIYAGCWSQGRWVSRGLYCRPDGIYIAMDTHGHPLIAADLAKAKMSATVTAAGAGNSVDSTSNSAAEPGKKTGAEVPPGGLGVPRRPARTMLPISSSILQDASPAKEVLDNVGVVKQSSSRKDLDSFLMWWATTRSCCGLQVPLDVPLVSKYQRMPAQLLRGGKSATVTIGSEAATYLTSPAHCTLSTPHTPSLTPIRLFVTLADSRKAMQAMVDGEASEGTRAANHSAEDPEGLQRKLRSPSNKDEERGFPPATPPPRLTTAERRIIDSDVEAAALRASRFMPVAIPRAPTVPITAATAPTATMASREYASMPSNSRAARDQSQTAEQQQQLKEAVGVPNSDLGSSFSRNAAVDVDVDGSAFGLTAWATRTPPSIDEEDITDAKLMAMVRAERLAWPTTTTTTSSSLPPSSSTQTSVSSVGSLMPPTPTQPQLGENTTITWNLWTTRDIPRYAPPPLTPIPLDKGALTSRSAPPPSLPPTTTTSYSSSLPSGAPPRTEADLYFACPFWEPIVPDAQMLLEQGKMTQAARLMRRLQREHQTTDKNSGGSSSGSEAESTEDATDSAWAPSAELCSSPGGARELKSNGSLDTLAVLQEMRAANGTGTGGSWTAGGLLSAEQRAQSGRGWAPTPMHGPFTFEISSSQKKRCADEQRWYFKVHQREVNSFQ